MVDYIKYGEFLEGVKAICNKHIGTINNNAYATINEEIQRYYESLGTNNHYYQFDFKCGCMLLDTSTDEKENLIDTDNIGRRYIFNYCIEWKPDKRSKRGGTTGKILDIEVKNELPEGWVDWYLCDIPQGVHYLLAKENRERLMIEYEKLERELIEKRAGVIKYEKIMKSESYDKTVLCKDLDL